MHRPMLPRNLRRSSDSFPFMSGGGADEVTNPTKSVFCDAAVAAPGSAMTVDRVVRLLNTGEQGWMLVESAPERLL
jgi:hypothetical protein